MASPEPTRPEVVPPGPAQPEAASSAASQSPPDILARSGRTTGVSSLMVRVGSAAVLLAIVLAALAAGQLVMLPVITVVVLVGTAEYYMITRRMGVRAAPWVLFPLTVVLLFRFQLDAISPVLVPLAITLSVGLGLAGFLGARGPVDGMSRWGMAVAGALYLGWTPGFYYALYAAKDPDPARIGTALLVALAGSTFVGDTVAFLVGSRFGRHPFFPAISPNKTLEGATAGLVAQTLSFAALGLLADIPGIHALVLGCLVGIAAQMGDLIESQLKRAAKVKNSSSLLPGHGGILDRIDSLILIPGVAYYYLELVLRVHLPQ